MCVLRLSALALCVCIQPSLHLPLHTLLYDSYSHTARHALYVQAFCSCTHCRQGLRLVAVQPKAAPLTGAHVNQLIQAFCHAFATQRRQNLQVCPGICYHSTLGGSARKCTAVGATQRSRTSALSPIGVCLVCRTQKFARWQSKWRRIPHSRPLRSSWQAWVLRQARRACHPYQEQQQHSLLTQVRVVPPQSVPCLQLQLQLQQQQELARALQPRLLVECQAQARAACLSTQSGT